MLFKGFIIEDTLIKNILNTGKSFNYCRKNTFF